MAHHALLCLPAPTLDFLKLELLDYDSAQQRTRLRFRPTEAIVNPRGVVQGGVIGAVLDDAVGFATAAASGKRPFTTAHLSTEFFRPCFPGDVLIATGQILRIGKRQATVDGWLKKEGEDKLIARATAIQIYLDTEVADAG